MGTRAGLRGGAKREEIGAGSGEGGAQRGGA